MSGPIFWPLLKQDESNFESMSHTKWSLFMTCIIQVKGVRNTEKEKRKRVFMCMCIWERERECVCVWICVVVRVWEREGERNTDSLATNDEQQLKRNTWELMAMTLAWLVFASLPLFSPNWLLSFSLSLYSQLFFEKTTSTSTAAAAAEAVNREVHDRYYFALKREDVSSTDGWECFGC